MGGAPGAVAGAELERAARLVLGRALGPGVARRELRRAFRRRALALHPDRAGVVGRDPQELAGEFRALRRAYELLDGIAGDRGPPPRRAPRPRAAGGPLPPRPLRFAEFLYYAGRISWSELAEALAWRRRDGRRIGRWFVEAGLLAPGEVLAVREELDRHNAGQR